MLLNHTSIVLDTDIPRHARGTDELLPASNHIANGGPPDEEPQ